MRLVMVYTALFCLLSSSVSAQSPVQYKQALPGYTYNFPNDDFSHDDFRIEWWYYTGNLHDENELAFGYQLTFFRIGLEDSKPVDNPSSWKIGNLYFAHMTVSDISNNKFHFFERINRKGVNNAGAASDRLHVWNENWSLTSKGKSHHLLAFEKGTGLDLKLTPIKKRVLHGKEGVSTKGSGSGNASHYFSFTRMKTDGQIFLQGKEVPVKGTSWMDHEFSSNQLNENLVGWDWFSMKLDNQTELMLYQLRDKNGTKDPHSSGTSISADGTSHHILHNEFTITPKKYWVSPHTNATYPASWELTIPGGVLSITPDLPDQELYNLRSISGSYWEGSVSIRGKLEGKPVKGKGYVELVGYEKALKQGDAFRE